MLVQLVLVYCLTADPAKCVEHRPIAADQPTGMAACMHGAQPEAARWLATKALREHPGATRVRVRLWRYATLPPERVRAGERPAGGRYEHERVLEAAALVGGSAHARPGEGAPR